MTRYQRLRRAVQLFRSDLVPREVRRANARQWLMKTEELGDKSVLRGGEVRWGINLQGAK
jgi:hypothetical protein